MGEPGSAYGVCGLVEKGVGGSWVSRGEQGTAPPETPLHQGWQCVPPGERGQWGKISSPLCTRSTPAEG